jgi:Flp pilus assembly protein TadD
MKRVDAVAAVALVLGLAALTGCEGATVRLDPLATDGRDGGGKPAGYATLMRIGAAAHAGGDLATSVGLFRRAAAVDPRAAAPFVAAGNTLIEMGEVNEAIVAYNSALARNERDPEALRGLARAYLMTGKPELAGQPLAVAYRDTPNDPKLLQLIGVAGDFAGQHAAAQARYRRGLELMPGDPGLSLNLALSLALTGDYAEAIGILRPIAMAVTASPRERQTLALIYGLAGDDREAGRLARLDLDAQAAQRNLAYYDTLRRLPADARARAIQALSNPHHGTSRPS